MLTKPTLSFRWSMEEYGWRGSHFILAGTVLHCLPLSLFIRSPPNLLSRNRVQKAQPEQHYEDKGTSEDKELSVITEDGQCKNETGSYQCARDCARQPVFYRTACRCISETCNFSGLRDPLCLLCALSLFFMYGSNMTVVMYMSLKARSIGLSFYEAPFVITVCGFGEVAGRFGTALITLIKYCQPSIIFICSATATGLTILSVAFCQTYWSLVMVAAAFGLFNGKPMFVNCVLNTGLCIKRSWYIHILFRSKLFLSTTKAF